MDKSKLKRIVSNRKIDDVIRVSEDDITGLSNGSLINFGNGSTIKLSQQNINQGMEIVSKIFDGMINIQTIKTKGDQAVRIIQTEIEKIKMEHAAEIEKLDKEQSNWNEKFDKKAELFFNTINKIEQSNIFSEEIKKQILSNLSKQLE